MGEQACSSHSNLTPRPDNLVCLLCSQTPGLHIQGLQTSSRGHKTAPGRGSRELGGNTGGGAGAQMHKQQHQRSPVWQSFGRGEDPGGSGREQDGVPMASGAWIRRPHVPHTSDSHNSGPLTGEMMSGVDMSPTEGDRRALSSYNGATRSEGSVQPGWEGTVSQRRSVDPRMVEGTQVFVATVALFGKVSADRAVRLVFHHVGAVPGWVDVLGKRPAFEPSWISWLCVKAFPKGTPMAWPRKRRFSIDAPPTTTIWTTSRTEASSNRASAPGRRWEAQQRWNHWSP